MVEVEQPSSTASNAEPPVAIVCVGMAGSGKTTFAQRVVSYLHEKKTPPYVVNLDPAVISIPFESNIDIRDTVNYKEVMKQYNLGPNGGILTSLNLFATKIDQIIGILEKRTGVSPPGSTPSPPPADPTSPPIQHILVDTPGQIEVFVWSASGDILLNSLASSFPTVIAYIIDTPRSASTSTFMSNMLYACSILYKTKLPMILVFNKTDVRDAAFAKEWMTDFESFQAALREEEAATAGSAMSGQGSGYMNSLLHSMSLMLDEFYKHLQVVGVSAMTGHGMPEFFEAVADKRREFDREYKVELDRRRRLHDKNKARLRERELGRLMGDLRVGEGSKKSGLQCSVEAETVSEAEEEDDDEEEQHQHQHQQEVSGGLQARYNKALSQTQGTQEDLGFEQFLQASAAKGDKKP